MGAWRLIMRRRTADALLISGYWLSGVTFTAAYLVIISEMSK